PELAARRHIETVESIVSDAITQAGVTWDALDAIAVTQGPGLAGALLVGVSFAKALAYARGIPLIAVNHLEAHIASAWLEAPDCPLPCVVLIVSGGHTHLYRIEAGWQYRLLGRTLDDAAGEAFDKAAKMLGLPYPGGPAIDRAAREGNPTAVRFPRPHLKPRSLDFSFSGLKTALLYYLRDLDRAGKPRRTADIAAGYQEAIVDVLIEKAFDAVRRSEVGALAVVGGVSANTRLRSLLAERGAREGIRLIIPRPSYCTDNAAMVAAAGRRAYLEGRAAGWDLEAEASLAIADEPPAVATRAGRA
ncbi:MAG TPA: tRNA (adenosine(37)-N6)-threonylcarbamoyltransferase complex transferase subunit TsaD, partial [Nitrospirales bacterium]|nr:tRNA (adenosine(37)-N6)-threonylcarbamoyltransferase complex transferase subunit TsaD [Nitrospirales bacterium]